MSGESLFVILLVGLIAGWLGGQIVRGTGFGVIADVCIGIIGALIGSWLLPRLGIHLAAHFCLQRFSNPYFRVNRRIHRTIICGSKKAPLVYRAKRIHKEVAL